MAIEAATTTMMMNWALWRIQRDRPGLAMSNAYSLGGATGSAGTNGPIVLLNDDAFEVEQALSVMPDYLKLAVVEYWLRVDPVARKAQRCGCPVRTYWRRLERAHQQIHTYRRDLHERQERERLAWKSRSISLAF